MRQQAFETVNVHFRMTGRSGSEQVLHSGNKSGVTPPEYKLMVALLRDKNNITVIDKGDPAVEADGLTDKGKPKFRPRTVDEEVFRLRDWYGVQLFKKVFGDEDYPNLPFTFDEIRVFTETPDNVRDITSRNSQDQQVNQISKALGGQKAADDDKGADDSAEEGKAGGKGK